MNKNGFFILLVTFLLLGCEEDELVYDNKSDNKILYGKVLEKRNQGMTLELTGESKEKYSDIISISVPDENMMEFIKEGQHLSLWYDFIRESNPPSTRALKVKIIPTES
ncbi:DUF3221 domain-containing protein [Bacillus sp. NTK074B]|uniref:DUF3221 domain-containing protein n=1 Tax=Bacillus sp. NTK074B TaxID=2802174 RepID=UPI001A8E632E|nr:DUF3221 domain-containing protein [Bacillus sp. NTK074B]